MTPAADISRGSQKEALSFYERALITAFWLVAANSAFQLLSRDSQPTRELRAVAAELSTWASNGR